MTITREEDKLRRELHAKGLSDKELARVLNLRPGSVATWRYANGLECNRKVRDKPAEVIYLDSVHYSEALSPEQCEEMREFLGCLWVLSKRQRGKVNVGEFIKEWRKQRGGVGSG